MLVSQLGLFKFLIYVHGRFAFVYAYAQYVGQDLQSPEEDVRGPGTGVRDTFKLLCGYWKFSPGSLEEKPVL